MLEYPSLLLQTHHSILRKSEHFGKPFTGSLSFISSYVIDDDDTNKSSALLHILELL